jgi:hypothetical protein
MNLEDPADRQKVIEALAAKVWGDQSRRSQLESHGLKSETQVKEHIEAAINDPRTKAFSGQPKLDRGHPVLGEAFPRQIFDLRQKDEERGKEYSTSVVLNPNPNPKTPGLPFGGTFLITSKDEITRLQKREQEATGITPTLVVGGVPALEAQRQRQQLVTVEKPVPVQQRTETLLERLDRERKERGDVALREVGKDRSLEQKREQERGL